MQEWMAGQRERENFKSRENNSALRQPTLPSVHRVLSLSPRFTIILSRFDSLFFSLSFPSFPQYIL